MSRSKHDEHRSALEALARGDHLSVVASEGERLGATAAHAPRTLRARLALEPDLIATLLVALGPRPRDVVLVRLLPDRPLGDPAGRIHVQGLGWLDIASASDDEVVARVDQLAGAGDSLELIRYHPGQRATVRVSSGHEGGGDQVRYAKVFSDDRGRARHELAEQLHAKAAEGRLGFQVARPDRYDADRYAIWQHPLPGDPGTERLKGSAGPALAGRLGAALATMAGSGLQPQRRLTEADLFARVARGTAELAGLVPDLADRAQRLLDALHPQDAPSDAGAPVPLHGAPYPSQWLVEGEDDTSARLGLLDFDRCSVGEPEHDVASFLAQIDSAHSKRYDVAGVAEAFLAGYEQTYGPLDRGRLSRYRSLRRLGKAVRSGRSLRPDGDRRAERALAAAEDAAAASQQEA